MINIPTSVNEVWLILQDGWQDLVSTDFTQLKYPEIGLAIRIGAVLAVVILLKLAWLCVCWFFGWHKYSRMDSGHTVSRDSERGLMAGFFLNLPTIALIIPFVAILFAITNPFLPIIAVKEKKQIAVRTRIDFRDCSGSMNAIFKGGKKNKGEVAMDAHLKFLKMRQGKNDRTALWIFSNNTFPVQEDFIMDDAIFYFKAFDAPWELGTADPEAISDVIWNNNNRTPKSRYYWADGQSGTQLSPVLKTAVQLFDKDEARQKKSPFYINSGRSIMIITDAAIADFYLVKEDLKELGKRKIIPYIIFIDEAGGTSPDEQAAVQQLLAEITAWGGKFFPVSDEKAIENAYREIDKLETAKVEVEKKVLKIPVFYKFVFFAIVVLIAIIPYGFLTELLSDP